MNPIVFAFLLPFLRLLFGSLFSLAVSCDIVLGSCLCQCLFLFSKTAARAVAFGLFYRALEMLDKEACCLVSQAIYEDLVLSFRNQGLLRNQLGPRVNQSHQVFFICRFPSELCTLQNHMDLVVISEDDLEPIRTALAGTRCISVVLFQVQTHVQEKLSSSTRMLQSFPLCASSMSVSSTLSVLT